jgi:hypothetical protein
VAISGVFSVSDPVSSPVLNAVFRALYAHAAFGEAPEGLTHASPIRQVKRDGRVPFCVMNGMVWL